MNRQGLQLDDKGKINGVKRKKPSSDRQAHLLKIQNGKCRYCDTPLNQFLVIGGKLVFVRVHWDHYKPYAFTGSNHDDNFIASCQTCNQIKSDRHFNSLQEAIDCVRSRLRERGYVFEKRTRKRIPKPQSKPKDWNWQAAADLLVHPISG